MVTLASFYFALFLLFINCGIHANPIESVMDGADLPICRVCTCNRRLRSVECVPRQGGQFRLRMIRLPPWAESFLALNLSQPEFPHFASHPGLRQLRLLHSGLSSLHPLAFAPLQRLELLQLADNALEEVPPELLLPLGHLRTLDLSGNRLAAVRLALSNAGQVLDQLMLDGNPLCADGIGGAIQLPLTRHLRMAGTGMVGVNGTHFSFGQANNKNNSTALCHLPFSPKNWEALEELRIGNNPTLVVTPEAMPQLSGLRLLDVSGAFVPEQLFLEWTRHEGTRWHHLDVHGTRIQKAPAFDYLPFGEAAISDQGLHGTSARWTLCSRELEWLDLSGLGLEGELDLSGCKHLKWLYADENRLNGIHFGDSAGPVALLSLSLRSNHFPIFPDGILAAGQSLLSLQMANNSLRHLPSGGRFLLEQFPHLQQLDLAMNRVRHFELDPPYKPEISAQLLSLNLSHNKLHTFHLATTLPSLNLLDLSANHLTSFASLDQLPALEHLHLARNTGIRLVGPTEPNTVLGQVDLANCSLEELPDMHRFYALKELQAAGNRLREVPSHLLPSKGISSLDLRGNSLQHIGWDWTAAQLTGLSQLRLEANPLDCACPMPERMAARLKSSGNSEAHAHFAYFCVQDASTGGAKWQHPLDAFLMPTDSTGVPMPSAGCPPLPGLFHAGAAAAYASADGDPSVAALFLVPILLVAGSLAIGLLLLRGSPRWQELHWAPSHTEAGSMLAYEQLHPEHVAESV